MRQKVDKVVDGVDVICDMCKSNVPNTSDCPARQCCMCQKDICDLCTVFDDRDDGDYPARYCESCWDVGRGFRAEQHTADEQYEKRTAETEKDWLEACQTDWDRWHDLLDFKAKRSFTKQEQTEYDEISKIVAKLDAHEALIARHAMAMMPMKETEPPQYVVCICNDGHRASLQVCRLYRILPDAEAEKRGLLRVTDESDEDYLFPANLFATVELPEAVGSKLAKVAKAS